LPQWSLDEDSLDTQPGFVAENEEGMFVRKIRVTRSSDHLGIPLALKWRPVENDYQPPIKGSAIFE
jgi:hypothetical protein